MPCSAASDLGLHCLPMYLLWDTRHKWVNVSTYVGIRNMGGGGGGGGEKEILQREVNNSQCLLSE